MLRLLAFLLSAFPPLKHLTNLLTILLEARSVCGAPNLLTRFCPLAQWLPIFSLIHLAMANFRMGNSAIMNIRKHHLISAKVLDIPALGDSLQPASLQI